MDFDINEVCGLYINKTNNITHTTELKNGLFVIEAKHIKTQIQIYNRAEVVTRLIFDTWKTYSKNKAVEFWHATPFKMVPKEPEKYKKFLEWIRI